MRVLRVVLGILTLLLAMPVLAAGAVGWWSMQHRSPDGAFQADLVPISAENRVIVFPDVDAVLRRDAPFARADQTELRLTAGPDAFVGMAHPADLAVYLAGADYTEISGVSLGRGPLTVDSRIITATDEPLALPSEQPFWVRGGTGELRWTPTTDRGRPLALIIIAPPGDTFVNVSVALTAGWLTSTTWGLLILGPVLLLLGLAALAWPQRPREVVYVVDAPTNALSLPTPRSSPQTLPALTRPSALRLSTPALPASLSYPAHPAPAVPARSASLSYPAFPDSPAVSARSASLSYPASPGSFTTPASPEPSFARSAPFGTPAPSSGALSRPASPTSPAPFSSSAFPTSPFAMAASSSTPAPSSGAFNPGSLTAKGMRAASGVPFAGTMPTTPAYLATSVSSGTSVPRPTQHGSQPLPSSPPGVSWPPAESPTTTEPAREIPQKELPLIDPECPMPTAGVRLHLAKLK